MQESSLPQNIPQPIWPAQIFPYLSYAWGLCALLGALGATACGDATTPRDATDAGLPDATDTDTADVQPDGDDLPELDVSGWTPGQAILIQDVTAVDAQHRRPHVDVRLRDGVITDLADHLSPMTTDARVDGRGRFLVPALVDPHVHLAYSGATHLVAPTLEANLRAQLLHGVLAVMDVGGPTTLFTLRDAIARGDVLGPVVRATGPFLTTEGAHPCETFPDPLGCRFVTAETATDEANALLDQGADAIKVALVDTTSLPWPAPRLAPAAVEAAAAAGAPVIVHIDANIDLVDAVDAGADVLAHPVFVEAISPLALERSRRVSAVHSTLFAFDGVLALVDGRLDLHDPDLIVARGVLDDWAQLQDAPGETLIPGYLDASRQWTAFAHANLLALHDDGAPVLPASDAGYLFIPHGYGLHRELQALQALGLPPSELFEATTTGAAAQLGLSPGLIETGARADVLLVDGDPTADIAAWADIALVFRAGAPLTRADILHRDLRPLPGGADEVCFDHGDCAGDLRCDGVLNTCQPACDPPWAVWGACGPDTFCMPAAGGRDGVTGVCHPEPSCDLITQDCPDAYDLTCVPVDVDTNTCVTVGPRKLGDRCDAWDADLQCGAGLFCSWIDQYCYPLCEPGNDASCGDPLTLECVVQLAAQDLAWFGVCLPRDR